MNSKSIALGDSVFNYDDRIYTPARFHHYWQQVDYLLKIKPRKLLEIGPGDHTITDFMRRKGVEVKTFDNDLELHPDYSGDIREPLDIFEKFDCVLASEVFEHMNFRYLPRILANIKAVLEPGGCLLVSLPYKTVRLFPPDSTYGRVLSCEGRVNTLVPFSVVQPALGAVRALHRTLTRRPGERFDKRLFAEHDDNNFHVHHWEVGVWPTTLKAVREVMSAHYSIEREEINGQNNCVFWQMRNS